MRGTQKVIWPRGLSPRDYRLTRGLWPRLELMALCAVFLFGALTADLILAAEQPLVQRVEAAPSADGLIVTITTNAPEPPRFRTFTLRNPDRLVFEFRGFRWEPRFAARLSAGRAGVERIRVAQYASNPPITRMVFDLSVPPDQVRYDAVSQPGVGNLRLNFLPPGAAPPVASAPPPPPSPAPAPAPQPAPVEPTPIPEPAPSAPSLPETAPPLPVEAVVQETPEPALPTPPPAPQPSVSVPEAPARAPAGPPGPTLLPQMLMGVLAVLVAAVAAVYLRDRIQIRRRRSHVRQALESEDPAHRATGLRDLNQWSPREIGWVRDMLLEAVHDASSSVAQQAIHLLRAAFPAEPLISQLERGTARGRAEAAALLVVHNPDVVAEPLLRAALSGPAAGREAASDALAKLAQSAPLPPLVRALVEDDEDAGALAAQIFRAAGSRGAQPLKAVLDDTDELIRCGAIEALLLIASEGSARAISARLSDPVPQVRARAARGLGLLQANSSFREPLLAALEDSSPAVQQAAALSLARMGGEDLNELLTALDRRISEQPDLPVADVLVEAIASRCASPSAALASAASSLNRGFATGLLQALERAGRLDEWVQQFARAEPQERELMLSVLRAAAAGGVPGPLLRGLELPEPKIQEASALLLGEAKEREAIQPLSHLLSVSHESVRVAAALALGQIGGSDAAAVLLPALEDPAAAVRTAATYGFGQSLAPAETGDEPAAEGDAGRTAASAALTKALRDPAAEVRAAAASGLAALRADEAVPALIDLALRDQEASARTAAVVALGEMRAQEVLPLLMDVVNDPDSGLRCRAIEIFGRAGDPMVAEVLVNALHDEDVNVRETAGRALWDIATRGHVETLVPYLKSPDPKVRSAIAGVIGKSEAAEHAASLAEAAADPDPFVRASIINAFHSMGEAAADYVPLLIERLADADAFVRARAAEALSAMAPTSEQAAREMLPLVSDPDPTVREAVAGSLLGFAERGMYGPLLELLGDPSRRPEALQLLHGADETKLRALLQTAQEAPTDVRRAAMETLSYLLSKRWTAKDFRQELDSLDPKVRVAGLEGLALVASPEAVRAVTRVLAADPSGEIRARAAEILSQWDDPVAQDALRNAAETDPDPRVRDAALLPAERHSAAP